MIDIYDLVKTYKLLRVKRLVNSYELTRKK